jgi:pimeloyl-ACP methyl ester carboxylesterase
MPFFERDDVSIHYEEHGSGFPILLIAPGGMRSTIGAWANAPWNPVEHLEPHFRVIVMDQRNAGRSSAPICSTDGWQAYTEDQLALLDHLGVKSFHVAGMCIGGPYCMGLVSAAPERVASAVLFQPIGLDGNRQAFFEMFDSWAQELKTERDDVDPKALDAFKQSMYGGDFLFNVSREFVAGCRTPLLVLCGRDLYHPESTSREIVDLAPNAELVERWKEPEYLEAAGARVLDFLIDHTA